jgi:hypothetical protein
VGKLGDSWIALNGDTEIYIRLDWYEGLKKAFRSIRLLSALSGAHDNPLCKIPQNLSKPYASDDMEQLDCVRYERLDLRIL